MKIYEKVQLYVYRQGNREKLNYFLRARKKKGVCIGGIEKQSRILRLRLFKRARLPSCSPKRVIKLF